MVPVYTSIQPPKAENISAIAKEIDIHPAFVEKDWYAVCLLKILDEFSSDTDIKLAFAGGTSLSKGFKIINRFSEDLDFILHPASDSRGTRSAFRKSIVSHIESYEGLEITDVRSHNKSNLFQLEIDYERYFEHASLLPYLKVEMLFSTPKLPTLRQDIYSIIGKVYQGLPEVQFSCLSAIETAANKMSALAWRMQKGDSTEDDRGTSRHLHDLAALKDIIFENKESFINCVKITLENDIKTRAEAGLREMSQADILGKAFELLSNESSYRKDYKRFVEEMFSEGEAEQIMFDEAVDAFGKLIKLL